MTYVISALIQDTTEYQIISSEFNSRSDAIAWARMLKVSNWNIQRTMADGVARRLYSGMDFDPSIGVK